MSRFVSGMKKLVDEARSLRDQTLGGRIVLLTEASLSSDLIPGFQEFCNQLAAYTQEPVELAIVADERILDARPHLLKNNGVVYHEAFEPRQLAVTGTMTSADFIYRDDGRPDWASMWEGFCELALYGGPPHRGEDTALHAPANPLPLTGNEEMVREIRRGIWETTGLFSEPAAEPGWIAVTCHSRKMAAWLCATIILENVDCKVEDERIFLPASPDFGLKDEVKSVITVLAKCNHYWEAHIAAAQAAVAAAQATVTSAE